MAKHHTRDEFKMTDKLRLIQAELQREKAIKATHGDILCMVIAEYMKERGLKLPETSAKTGDPLMDCFIE